MYLRNLPFVLPLAFLAFESVFANDTSTVITSQTSSSITYCPCTDTSIVTTTKTPSPFTLVVSTTVTVTQSAPSSTKTNTVTATSTVTTITSVSTSKTISTTVVKTDSTKTIATSAGFIPVQGSLPKGSYVPQPVQKRNFGKKRESVGVQVDGGVALEARGPPGTPQCSFDPAKCSTVTITQTQTAQTSTVTSTKTSTTTVTHAGASTTITVTSKVTATATSVSTSTSTSVSTSYTKTVTSYAACATNNFINFIDGHATAGYSLKAIIQNSDAKTPYDCCVAAITNPLGSFWVFYTRDSTCQVFLPRNNGQPVPGGKCDNGQNSNEPGNTVFAYEHQPEVPVEVVGNANCGKLDDYLIAG